MKYIKSLSDGTQALFYFITIIAVFLIVIGFALPPIGAIDTSALSGVGWLFAFASLCIVMYSVSRGMDARISRGDTSIQITNPDPMPEEDKE